jgi:hypothetical protein
MMKSMVPEIQTSSSNFVNGSNVLNSLAETYITKGDMDFLKNVGSPVKISSTVKLNNLAILTAKGKLGSNFLYRWHWRFVGYGQCSG